MTDQPDAIRITWAAPLTLADMAAEKAALEAALLAKPDRLLIDVARADDHLARQLIAALRVPAAGAGIAIEITAQNGDWAAMTFKDIAA